MFSRKYHVEEIPEVMTGVWTCTNSLCNSWMREEFTFDSEPLCPQCQSAMAKETRLLPQLSNIGYGVKFPKKGAVSARGTLN